MLEVSLGEQHGLARVEGSGQVFAWGNGEGGRLGGAKARSTNGRAAGGVRYRGASRSCFSPAPVPELTNCTCVSASPWGGTVSMTVIAPACKAGDG